MRQKDKYLRQRQIVSPTQLNFPIEICGGGGVGSIVALVLGKMGCQNVTVIDFDKVEMHNLASQLYAEHQVGQTKVSALQETVNVLTGLSIIPVVGKYQDLPPSVAKVIVCAVDSLKERKEIWNGIYRYKNLDLFIDSRMGAEVMRIITVDMRNPESVARYEKILANKTKPHREVCTAKAIAYNTFVIGGLIGSIIKKYAKEETMKREFVMDLTNFATN